MHGHNCKEVEGKRGQNCWSDEQSAVSPSVKSTSHQSVFVPRTWKVWQLTIRRDKLWLQFFFSLEPSLVSFFGRGRERKFRWMDGWIDGEKPHRRHWWKTCRLLGDRSTHGLRLPWEPGYMASRTDTGVFAFAQVWTRSDRYVSMAKREGWKGGNALLLCPCGQFPQEKEVQT